jgi:omega-amidase
MLKFALVQFAPVFEKKKANKEYIRQLLAPINQPVDMIIFPELTLTGFTMRSRKFAEDEEGESVQFFSSLATQYHAHIFAGLITGEGPYFYNTLCHLNPAGQMMAKYYKIHPFSFSGENKFYTAGTEPLITRIDRFRIGLAICYDLRFPELFRLYAKKRVHVIIDIANWPHTRIEHWRSLLKARSIEDQCYVIGVNRIGNDKKNVYNGYSCVFAPFGEEICQAGEREGIVTGTVSLEQVIQVQHDYPFLNDIRLI